MHFLSQTLLHNYKNVIGPLFCYVYKSKAKLSCFYITICYSSIKLLKELSKLFHLTYSLLAFQKNFSTLIFFWFLFCNFFLKCSNKFFTFKIANKLCPQSSIFNSCNRKNFFRRVSNLIYCKTAFMFWNSYMIINFEFRIFSVILFTKMNVYVWLNINRLHV